MVYGRSVEGKTLSFEASGALLDASLVMRDRETDSWWSIMTSDAIGGELVGTRIPELPVGEKTTWGDWVARHPDTSVLSVDGTEHVDNNPYERYFESDGTFRGAEIDDDRLGSKAPIYSFHLDGTPYAVAHETIEGGRVIEAGGRRFFFFRRPGAHLFASSEGWLLPDGPAPGDGGAEAFLARLEAGEVEGARRLGGFDTYWYTWVSVNGETELLE